MGVTFELAVLDETTDHYVDPVLAGIYSTRVSAIQ